MVLGITKHIPEILIQHGQVNLPWLGTLSIVKKPANIDWINGQIQAPYSEVLFNTSNSDTLYFENYLVERFNITLDESTKMVEQFSKLCYSSLEKNETVNFPNLGKLMRDENQHIYFIAEVNNSISNAFGLPAVSFRPILRDKIQAIKQSSSATGITEGVTNFENNKQKKIANIEKYYLAASVVFFVIMLSVCINYFVIKPQHSIKALPTHVNMPPIKEKENTQHNTLLDELDDELASTTPSKIAKMGISTEKRILPHSLPKDEIKKNNSIEQLDEKKPLITQKKLIIIVSAFKENSNADNFLSSIKEQGYDTYSDVKGNLTRVGVSVNYDSPTEKANILKKMRNQFNKDAWILKS